MYQFDFMLSLPPPLTPPGTNSTVTPGLRTAGVVISSVGVGIPFIISTVLGCLFLCGTCECTEKIVDRLVAVKERIKKTKGEHTLSHISGY